MFVVSSSNEYVLTIDKSKFIAIVMPFNDINNLNNYLENIKNKYSKAKHYLYVYKVDALIKSNDDGEPGSISKCFLELIIKRNINKVLIVVVRYFGGILLGASRLLRTYVNAITNALDNTKLSEERYAYVYSIECDYPTFNKIKDLGYHVENVRYFDRINLDVISILDIDEILKLFKVKINKEDRKLMII